MCFAGLYDTVSSYGFKLIGDSYINNTAELNLKAVRQAKKVIQLVAAEEHRKNFSLTNVNSAGFKMHEIFLPGVHSDIGGGYRDNAKEDQDVHWSFDQKSAEEDRSYLIAAGWYTEKELTLKKSSHRRGKHQVREVTLNAKRENLKNHYSRIPLHIMARLARESKISINSKLERDDDIPPELGDVKSKLDSYVNKVIGSKDKKSSPKDWLEKKSWLCSLRHDYLHFSARYEFGHEPCLDNGKRYRKQYEG